MPNSRRQVLIGGLVCLAIWPGIGIVLLLIGELRPDEAWWLIVSPWIVVTLLGVYLCGQAVLAEREWPRFEKIAREKQRKKEQGR